MWQSLIESGWFWAVIITGIVIAGIKIKWKK